MIMEMIRYRKPNWKPTSTMTKGVKTGKMKVFFKDGKVPYEENQNVMIRFKTEKRIANILKVNVSSITVQIAGIKEKKVIPFQNVIKII